LKTILERNQFQSCRGLERLLENLLSLGGELQKLGGSEEYLEVEEEIK